MQNINQIKGILIKMGTNKNTSCWMYLKAWQKAFRENFKRENAGVSFQDHFKDKSGHQEIYDAHLKKAKRFTTGEATKFLDDSGLYSKKYGGANNQGLQCFFFLIMVKTSGGNEKHWILKPDFEQRYKKFKQDNPWVDENLRNQEAS